MWLTINVQVPVQAGMPLVVEHGHDEAQDNEQEKQQDDQVVGLFIYLYEENNNIMNTIAA